MANEPERPIETLLRAAAKKRRDEAGAPFELHPADRRLLQGEVARKFARPQAETRSFAALVARLRPRLAWGVGILAILGLSVWVLLPLPRRAESEALLARNQPVSRAMPVNALPPAPTAAPATIAPAPSTAAEAKSAEVVYAETAPSSRPAPASQLGMAPPLLAKDTSVAQAERQAGDKLEPAAPAQLADQQKQLQYNSQSTLASANRAAPTPAAPGGLSESTADALKGAKALALTQRFVQTAPAAPARSLFDGKAAPVHAVLASFQLEQTGSQLRIVDGDGSVYSGYVQPADAARRARSAKAAAPAVAGAARAPAEALNQRPASSLDLDRLASQTYSFRVAGTNRSLNQQVVFTGDLLPATNLVSLQPTVTNLSTGIVLERYQNAPAQQGQWAPLNSRISGKVVIGTGKAVEINALPASP